MMSPLGERSGEYCRASRNVEANDLKQPQARRCQHGMLQMGFEQGIEHHALGEGKEVIGQEAIENDLPLSKWTREKKFDIRRLEDQSALQKSFEERAAEHQQCAPNQAFGPN